MGQTEDIWLDRNCWKNKSRLYRYFAMLNLCILGFGEFVAYDSLGSLQKSIMSNMNLNAQEFSYFYSVGSWPSIILCFFGGFLIDKVFGIKVGAVIYASIVLIGHFIFAIGILFNHFWCALFGRFLFGIGVEFILICLLYYSVYYFKGKELSMVQCLTLAISRLGSSAMFEMAYPLLDSVRQVYSGSKDIGIVMLIVSSFTVASVLSTIMLLFMSPKKENSCVNEGKACKEIKLTDVLHFGVPFWLAVVASCAFCMNIYILLPFSQGFFMTLHGLTAEEANTVAGFFSLMGAASAFFIGILVDKIGHEVSFVVLGFTLASTSHLILAFTTVSPFFSMFILAMSFSFLTASLFPLYAYIVPEKKLGTAYGTKQAIVNFSFAIIIILAGMVVDNFGYQALEIFVLANVQVGLISSIILWLHNFKNQGNLNWNANKRRFNHLKDQTLPETAQPLNQKN